MRTAYTLSTSPCCVTPTAKFELQFTSELKFLYFYQKIECYLVFRFHYVLILIKKKWIPIVKIVKSKFDPRQLKFQPSQKNEQDACWQMTSRILQFQVNFHLDVFQDHFAQSLCILHGDCALDLSNISYFFYPRQDKSCARVAQDQLLLVTGFLFFLVLGVCLLHYCDIWICTWCTCTAVQQITNSDFTII